MFLQNGKQMKTEKKALDFSIKMTSVFVSVRLSKKIKNRTNTIAIYIYRERDLF